MTSLTPNQIDNTNKKTKAPMYKIKPPTKNKKTKAEGSLSKFYEACQSEASEVTESSDNTSPELLDNPTAPETHKILNQIISEAKPQDFQALAASQLGQPLKAADGTPRKPNQKEAVVLICGYLTECLQKSRYGISMLDGEIRVYTGSHWQPVNVRFMKTVLGRFAEAIGYKAVDARFFRTRDMLFQQAESSVVILERPHGASLVNFSNGTLHIKSGTLDLLPHSPEDGLTYVLPFDYNPKAEYPIFGEFLSRVMPDDECQVVLAEFYGSIFIPDLKLEKTLINLGAGHNGKSVLSDVITSLLGNENVSTVGLDCLKKPESRIPLVGKLLNYGSEIKSNVSPDIFKKASSGEPLEFRRLYGDLFTTDNYARLAFNANMLPSEVEHTKGFFRRFLIIPFEQTISDSERDPDLAKKIIDAELSGVMNWILQGMMRLQVTRKFSSCKKSDATVEDYQHESDTVAGFLEEEEWGPSPVNRIKQAEVYCEYSEFCKENGFHRLSRKNFNDRLENHHHYEKGRHGDIGRFWRMEKK